MGTTKSLDPKYWGKNFWYTIISICFTYPTNPTTFEKISIMNFFNSLCFLLPCPTCRMHYSNIIKKYPIKNNAQCRKRLLDWIQIISDKVNEKLEKPLINIEIYYKEMEENSTITINNEQVKKDLPKKPKKIRKPNGFKIENFNGNLKKATIIKNNNLILSNKPTPKKCNCGKK